MTGEYVVQVTVGEEGFFGPNDPNDASNPQYSQKSTWPQMTGQVRNSTFYSRLMNDIVLATRVKAMLSQFLQNCS